MLILNGIPWNARETGKNQSIQRNLKCQYILSPEQTAFIHLGKLLKLSITYHVLAQAFNPHAQNPS